MNIKITHSWLLDHLDTDAEPKEIQKYLSLCGPSIERIEQIGDETVYDIEITTNRIDTASVYGIAREAKAILPMFKKKAILKKLQLADDIKPQGQIVPITIQDNNSVCRRVLGVVLEIPQGIQKSPQFIIDRLSACGIRSLNNLVDITNYVMLEVGHPTHVFDYDRISSHTLIIRKAHKGEKIVTLDEKEYSLDDSDIIIDDGTGRVIDLPGIMGTANSVVTSDTKRILFFIESNDPVSIRRTSMRYGIRTMASTINEKNPDSELAMTALQRGIALYETIAGAKRISEIIDIYPTKPKQVVITTSPSFISRRIGIEIPVNTIVSILQNLSFEVQVTNNKELTILVPTHRITDVTIPEDIVEEVARVHGYFAIPTKLQPPQYVAQPHNTEALFTYQYIAKLFLKHSGYHEVMNYSGVSLELLTKFGDNKDNFLFITNSISEEIKYLRQSLIPSLVRNVVQNIGFHKDIRLFELAKVYVPTKENLPKERFILSLVSTVSLDDLKLAMCGLMQELNITYELIPSQQSAYLLSTAAGNIMSGGNKIGVYGQVKNLYTANLDLTAPVYVAELEFEPIMLSARQMPVYKPYSQYAVITQDITVQKNQPYSLMAKKISQVSPILAHCSVKDQYRNSITLRLQFTDTKRNISIEEVKKEIEKIKSVLQ